MKKVEDKTISNEYGKVNLYVDDLINILNIGNKYFNEYELELGNYIITNEDFNQNNIKECLDHIKKDSKEIHNMKFISNYLKNFNERIIFKLEINDYITRIYSSDNNIVLKGIISEFEDIIKQRELVLGKYLASKRFYYLSYSIPIIIFIVSIFMFIYFKIDKNYISFLYLISLWLFILALLMFINYKKYRNKIYLIKYNEKNSWYSEYIRPHLSSLIIGIIGAAIGGIIATLVLTFLNM